MSSIQSLYMYGIVARAASQAWLGMDGQGIGVQGVQGSIPGGTTPFDGVSFKWERLESEDKKKVLRLNNNSRDQNVLHFDKMCVHCILLLPM